MAESHAVSGLAAKRSELTREIAHYQALIKRLTVDVSHLDAAIKILSPDFDLRTIRSKEGIRKPKSRADYWLAKIERNRQHDHTQEAALKSLGWRVLVVWECELQNSGAVASRIKHFYASVTQ